MRHKPCLAKAVHWWSVRHTYNFTVNTAHNVAPLRIISYVSSLGLTRCNQRLALKEPILYLEFTSGHIIHGVL